MRWMSLLCWLITAPLWAQERLEVDLELFLAVDVSRSMQPWELEIQRRGYAEALRSPEVVEAITGGLIGRVALTYVEWAGVQSQTVIVPWTLVEDAATAEDIAGRLTAFFNDGMRRTSISGVLRYASESFELNTFDGLRRVIDISGDGPNNMGPPVAPTRDRVAARGIIVNGLPLMTRDVFSERFGIEDLDVYYANCVITGPGAFVVPVFDWEEFAPAIKRKLILEIAGTAPVQTLHKASGYDCLIGEKIWDQFIGNGVLP